MLLLRRPTSEAIRDFLATQGILHLTYPAVGAKASTPLPGYVVDHSRIKLGEGQNVAAAARAALERWDHFRLAGCCPAVFGQARQSAVKLTEKAKANTTTAMTRKSRKWDRRAKNFTAS